MVWGDGRRHSAAAAAAAAAAATATAAAEPVISSRPVQQFLPARAAGPSGGGAYPRRKWCRRTMAIADCSCEPEPAGWAVRVMVRGF